MISELYHKICHEINNRNEEITQSKSLPYKKYIYGNDTVYIWFIYVFINSVLKFRIFNKDLIFCDFIKTRCVCNLYGIFKPYMQIIRFAYVIYKPYIFYIRYIKYCKLQPVTFFEDILIKFFFISINFK